MPEFYMPDTISQAIEDGWADDIDQEEHDDWAHSLLDMEFEAEAAAFEDQRAFERWADDQILDDENADVSQEAYVTYLEGFFPPD